MTKFTLLLSIILFIGFYASAVEANCEGHWCHSAAGYSCGCADYVCSSSIAQGTCMKYEPYHPLP